MERNGGKKIFDLSKIAYILFSSNTRYIIPVRYSILVRPVQLIKIYWTNTGSGLNS